MRPSFTILKKDRRSQARLGLLRTPHGTIRTPSYVIVATHGRIRTLEPKDVKRTGTQMVISNTYHLWNEKEVHGIFGTRMPMMTDSGGFQVFSFGAAKEQGVGKVLRQPVKRDGRVSNVRITEKGVHFKVSGIKRFISAESSIATQARLGADIIFAFDECTSPLHPFSYQKESMARTHRWAERSLRAHTDPHQLLYGIVQGGRFKSLRAKSAKTIGAMAFDGFGIGGSFGEDSMAESLSWITPHLPEEKPRHLLGIGTVHDIFIAVEAGMDTFDCVIPTREARHGRLYTDAGTRHVKIKTPEDARKATLHNVKWFNGLLKRIRAALADDSYWTFKKNFLRQFSRRA